MDHADNADAKAVVSVDTDAVGFSSSPDSRNERPDVSGDTTNTVDGNPAKDDSGKTADELKAEADAKAKEDAEAEADAKAKADAEAANKDGDAGDKTGQKGQEGRFDQHPDWIRMKEERDNAVLEAAKLKGVVEGITQVKGPEKVAGGTPADELPKPLVPYKDITKMSREEILEWMEDDPQGYEANRFAQFMHERDIIDFQRNREIQKTTTIRGTFEQYEKDNPDFKQMWDSGEIKKYMDAHPGHNAISAHLILTKEAASRSLDEKIKEAVDKTIKETTEKVTADFRAKRNAQTIGDGPGGVKMGGANEDLKDTKTQGGLVSALAGRLQKMRAAANGG